MSSFHWDKRKGSAATGEGSRGNWERHGRPGSSLIESAHASQPNSRVLNSFVAAWGMFHPLKGKEDRRTAAATGVGGFCRGASEGAHSGHRRHFLQVGTSGADAGVVRE